MSRELKEKLKSLSIEELKQVYRNVFSGDAGQIVLEDLRNRSYIYTTTIDEHFNPTATVFNEGIRATILHIETMLRDEPSKEIDTDEFA